MSKIKIAIAGCGGRMGRALLEGVAQSDDLMLHAALEHAGSALLGQDASVFGGTRGVAITADVEA
ncbi:MAG TPA: 4-hydroxy-tetrahydrodipicolinate reductase, partial [Gallionella sp.]|nr:4-hydroxy-tetrahydrodipicolinate reductase [Gallionella sp.]